MKILVAPLNWGLGHASRCVPLVRRFLDEGHEVILGGDGESLTLLRKHFPALRYVYLAPLNLRYSAGKSQVCAIIRALPRLFLWALKDHTMLRAVLKEEHIDRVVSDNRFGLYLNRDQASGTETVYITHQLHIMLPKGWRWAEPLAARMHARIYTRYNKVWVPDYEEPERSLAGELSHPDKMQGAKDKVQYIGSLSRFGKPEYMDTETPENYDTVAVLSGLEPHRTLLEQAVIARFAGAEERVLVVQGQPNRPNTRIKRGNITVVPHMKDDELAKALLGARHIIARSGYSTIMDLEALGLISRVSGTCEKGKRIELIPTPGQPEQEYLAGYIQ